MSKQQLSLFEGSDIADVDFDYAKGDFKEEKTEPELVPYVDTIMQRLELINQFANETNRILQEMIDEMQANWTEEEKLQVSNPKEYYRQQKVKKAEENKEKTMASFSTEAQEVIKNCTVEGMVVKLPPDQLDRKVYSEVKNKLGLIGGVWKGGKVGGFLFEQDPTDLLQQIASGESRNLKKEYQFFGTPDALADRLVDLAEIKEGDSVLEPSAGQGAIIKAVYRAFPYYMTSPNDKPCVTIDYCELMDLNKSILSKTINSSERFSSSTSWLADDFLSTQPLRHYDVVIANPPFAKNQDIDHIYKMFEVCKPGGRIVTIASKHWQTCNNKKELSFSHWLQHYDAQTYDLEQGEFKESGTNIAACIIVIDKPL